MESYSCFTQRVIYASAGLYLHVACKGRLWSDDEIKTSSTLLHLIFSHSFHPCETPHLIP